MKTTYPVQEVKLRDEIDLQKIADSGQCFRAQALSDGVYRFLSGNLAVQVRLNADKDKLLLECAEDEVPYWANYFDLTTDYRAIREAISPEDTYLKCAAAYGEGIRILRQEPWEALVSFVISQRKSIPAIRTSVGALTEIAGEKRSDASGMPYYTFPSPEALASLTISQIASTGVGYRAKYLSELAQTFASRAFTCDALEALGDTALHSALLSLYGVGEKVASCAELFGFHRMNAFPKDVWMNKVLSEHYTDGYPFEKYAPYNGLMQQYLFFYRRASVES